MGPTRVNRKLSFESGEEQIKGYGKVTQNTEIFSTKYGNDIRLNIGLNTSPSDSFVSYLNSHLGYSAGEFQALQLIVLAVFGAVD